MSSFWILLELRMELKLKDMQIPSQIVTTNKTTQFLQAGCPSCHPTNSVKALKGTDDDDHAMLY